MTPDFELLRDIAAAADGLPEDRLEMSIYGDPFAPVCKTVGCVAGFLCKHPKLGGAWYGINPPEWRRIVAEKISGYNSVDYMKAWMLFEVPQPEERSLGLTGKQIFGRRVVKYLLDHNQPVSLEYLAKYGTNFTV